MLPRLPTSTLFPYTTLFRSKVPVDAAVLEKDARLHAPDGPEVHLGKGSDRRSEEHTSELQSRVDLVCRLLLEKKKKIHVGVCPKDLTLKLFSRQHAEHALSA